MHVPGLELSFSTLTAYGNSTGAATDINGMNAQHRQREWGPRVLSYSTRIMLHHTLPFVGSKNCRQSWRYSRARAKNISQNIHYWKDVMVVGELK
jgi:hypothetical protein